MKLEKVTKLKDLRLRRQKLREEMSILDQKIKRAGQDLQEKGIKAYLTEGTTEAPADLELQKLKKRLIFLSGLDKIMEELLVKTVHHDRQQRKKWIERELVKTEKARKKRYDYFIKLKKQAEAVREESLSFKQGRLELEAELHELKQPTKTVSLRLSELEEFLKTNFLLGDDLREKVKAARQHNRKILEKGRPGPEEVLYRNFEIKYSLESGQTLELELTEQNAKTILRNFDLKKLAREVT